MTSLRATAAAVPMLLIALTGCSGDGAPEAESTFTPTATPTPTPTPSPSGEATPTTPALGPEETVEAWVAAQNTALLTGDLAELRALSDRYCKNCSATFIEPIGAVYEAGGRYDTAGWTIVSTNVRKRGSDRTLVDAAVKIAKGVTVASEVADPVSYPADRRILSFSVADGVVQSVEFVS